MCIRDSPLRHPDWRIRRAGIASWQLPRATRPGTVWGPRGVTQHARAWFRGASWSSECNRIQEG
eukprot:2702533-Alexandrium_andersonii.AAC.1